MCKPTRIVGSVKQSSKQLKLRDNKIMNCAFPIVPQNTRRLVDLVFWHSFLLTITTPVFRYFNRRWRGESTIYALVAFVAPVSITSKLEEFGFIHPGIDYPEEGQIVGSAPTVGIDRAFALHAGLSLLWVIVAYIEISHAQRISNRKFHKIFGYVAAVSFAGHVFGAAHNVYTDVVRHTAISKLILLHSLMGSAVNFIIGIGHARHGWKQKHEDRMMMCFLHSLNGAGPIRTVTHVQSWMGVGPVLCQNQYFGMASQCQMAYINRMVLVGLFTTYFFGMYVKIRDEADLTRWYFQDVFRQLYVAVAAFTFGLFYSDADWMLHKLFGEPRTQQNDIIVTLGVLVMIWNGIREYGRESGKWIQDESRKKGDER